MTPIYKQTRVHLGCGQNLFKNWLNIDKFEERADLQIDLDKTPWPLPDNHFSEIYMCHVLEHLTDVQKVMDEIWRISKNDSKITIIVPHFSSFAAASPFHKHFFNSQAMNYFTGKTTENYGKAKFKIKNTRIFWYPSSNEEYLSKSPKRKFASYFGEFLDFFINLNRNFFERIWCYWVGGAFEIKWEISAVK